MATTQESSPSDEEPQPAPKKSKQQEQLRSMATAEETSAGDEEPQPGPSSKKSKHNYGQKFRSEWLSQKEFKGWLVAPSGNSKDAKCGVCNKTVRCHRSSLVKHSSRQVHINNMKTKQSSLSVKDVFERQYTQNIYKENTEIQVAAFIATHNLPFTLASPLISLIQARAPTNTAEKASLAQIRLSDTKCTNIIRQGLGLYFAEELVKTLRETKFSIIPDETTDVSTEKQLGIVVIYCNIEKMEIVTRFFDLVPVTSSTAEGLYSVIKQSLLEKGIPMKNVVGYSSDTTNVMLGDKSSVVSLLKKDLPHVVTIRCSCHMIHLCASYACLKLSTSLEDMLRNIHAHFSRLSQRIHTLEEFQTFCNIPVHKILDLSQTRWLSAQNVVNKVLEQWDALQLYFTDQVTQKKDPSHTVITILQALNSKFMKAQLEFMSFQLQRLNAFNPLFQSEAPLLHHLQGEVTKLLKEVLCDFMKLRVVRCEDRFEVNIQDSNNRVDVDHVYVGVAATATLSEVIQRDPSGARQVRVACRNYMVELAEQIRERFKEIKRENYDHLNFLVLSNAVNCHPASLSEVYKAFPFLHDVAPLNLVDMEWRKQAIEETEMLKANQTDLQFWRERLNKKSISGDLKYTNLSRVIGCMMSLPCANAPVERLFSSLKLIKTDHRNTLKRESVVGLLHGKEGMASIGLLANELNLQDHPRLLKHLRNVKSNATDNEAHEIVANKLGQ